VKQTTKGSQSKVSKGFGTEGGLATRGLNYLFWVWYLGRKHGIRPGHKHPAQARVSVTTQEKGKDRIGSLPAAPGRTITLTNRRGVSYQKTACNPNPRRADSLLKLMPEVYFFCKSLAQSFSPFEKGSNWGNLGAIIESGGTDKGTVVGAGQL